MYNIANMRVEAAKAKVAAYRLKRAIASHAAHLDGLDDATSWGQALADLANMGPSEHAETTKIVINETAKGWFLTTGTHSPLPR